jgi:hypothetical protein
VKKSPTPRKREKLVTQSPISDPPLEEVFSFERGDEIQDLPPGLPVLKSDSEEGSWKGLPKWLWLSYDRKTQQDPFSQFFSHYTGHNRAQDLQATLRSIEPELSRWELALPLLQAPPIRAIERITDALETWRERLRPLLDELEHPPVPPLLSPNSEKPFRTFDARLAWLILLLGFLPGMVANKKVERQYRNLVRQEKAAIQLKQADLSPSQLKALNEIHEDQRAEIIAQKQRKALLHGKNCPSLSIVISALTTYLSRCLSLSLYLENSADVYRMVGDIIEAVTTPSCFACGHPHRFPDWRNVQEWDRYKTKGKGQWATRHTRVEKAHAASHA